MIEARQVEHGGMQVVDVHAVFDRVESKIVGGPMDVI